MPRSELGKKVGVFSHGGTKNLGDEALLATVIQNVRRRVPDAEVIGFTINPEDTQKRHGILCYPIRSMEKSAASHDGERSVSVGEGDGKEPAAATHTGAVESVKNGLKRVPGARALILAARRVGRKLTAVLAEPGFLVASYRRLRGVKLLLVAGSQQLNDNWGGAWGFPYTLLKWAILCKLNGTKMAILSVGAGPISSSLSKFFIGRTLGLADYRSYRDSASSRLMESMGVKGSHPVFPDLVYSLQLPAARPAPNGATRVVVGTNPVPFFDGRYWPTSDPQRYEEYVNNFARFAEWLSKSGHAVLFFPTQVRADVLTISDIRQAMNGAGDSSALPPAQPMQTLDDLVSEIARADFVVASRYHGILIPLAMNKPVLGVAYHEKCRALLEQVGQGDYVLEIEDFTVEDMIERFQALEANAAAIRKQIAERMASLRQALDQQYDAVFGLIGVKPTAEAP